MQKRNQNRQIRSVIRLCKKLVDKLKAFRDECLADLDTIDAENLKKSMGAFAESQKKWIEYRDAECRFVQSNFGGSSQPMFVYSRRRDLTLERVKALGELLSRYKR